MHINTLLQELYSRKQGEIKLDLDRVTRLAALLGNPEKKLKAIHVAGSNGKGSTCAFLFSILREAGYNVGLYTSPHLRHFNERIRINNEYISNRDIVRLYRRIKNHMAGDETFFEITTMMAFLYFAEKKVEVAIIEVGLGGRLDATNILTPLVSVITSIGLDHTNILGTTIKKIAGEKGGIIKPRIPIITSAKGEALTTIKKIAKDKNAPLTPSLPWKKSKGKISVNGYRNLTLGLRGDYQAENAALAITIVEILKMKYSFLITANHIKMGLKKAYWPGRMEYLAKNILADSAHNAEGMRALGSELGRIKKKKIIILGILKDKDIRSMMKIVNNHARLLILTTPKSERAAPPEALAKFAIKPCLIIPEPKEALAEARKMIKKGELIVITGSIYLLGSYLDPMSKAKIFQ